MNKPKVIIFSIIGLLITVIFIVIYSKVSGGEEETLATDIPSAPSKERFTYTDMMKYREDNSREVKSKISVDNQGYDTLNFSVRDEAQETDLFGSPVQSEQKNTSRHEEPVRYEEPTPRQSAPRNSPRSSPSGGNSRYDTERYSNTYENIVRQEPSPRSEGSIEQNRGGASNNPPQKERRRNLGFIDNSTTAPASSGALLNVTTYGDQFVQNGGMIKLRTSNPTTIDGVSVPRNTIVYGVTSNQGDRMIISIKSILVNNKPISINLTGYDASDGGAGLRVAQQEIDPSLQNAGSSATDDILNSTGVYRVPVIGGITRTAKDLFTRNKGKGNGIVVTDGYKLILK